MSLAAAGTCPPEMVNIENRYCIDRFEASLEKLTDEGREPWSPYLIPYNIEGTFFAVSKPGGIPQGYISGKQAALACQNSRKRLCTKWEWLTACQGPEGTLFPYGNTYEAGACNHHTGVHPLIRFHGKNKRGWTREELTNPGINQQTETLAPAGSHRGCVNAYGVYDMVGSLQEWIDDPAGTFLGEFYFRIFHPKKQPGCRYYTTAHPMQYLDYSTGFRCCADIQKEEE